MPKIIDVVTRRMEEYKEDVTNGVYPPRHAFGRGATYGEVATSISKEELQRRIDIINNERNS